MLWLPTLSITLHALTRNGVRRARFFSHFVAVFFDSARFRKKTVPFGRYNKLSTTLFAWCN